MTREAIADRLVNYSDAIVAFSLVNSLAFLIALTERDVRCSLVDMRPTLWVAIFAFAVFLSVGLLLCRHAEVRLRAGFGPQDQDATRALRYFHIARLLILWVGVALCVPLIRMALSDASCGPSAV
jgi:hypothetical protein